MADVSKSKSAHSGFGRVVDCGAHQHENKQLSYSRFEMGLNCRLLPYTSNVPCTHHIIKMILYHSIVFDILSARRITAVKAASSIWYSPSSSVINTAQKIPNTHHNYITISRSKLWPLLKEEIKKNTKVKVCYCTCNNIFHSAVVLCVVQYAVKMWLCVERWAP